MTDWRGANVYVFPGGEPASANAAGSPDEPQAGTDSAESELESLAASDLRAMAECLQYLYRESNRLDAKTTSRLIGAAAMAVAEDIRERER